MVLDGVLNIAKGIGDWFISSVPKPFKVALFLLLLAVSGSAINSFFVQDYECFRNEANATFLVDIEAYRDSIKFYVPVMFFKANVSMDSFNLTGKSKEYNETAQEFVRLSYSTRWGLGFATTFTALMDRVSGFFTKTNQSSFNFFDRINNPQNYMCPDLYESLPLSVNERLGLYHNCTINDIPLPDQYYNATKINDSGSINQIFSVKCFNEDPGITAFGFPLLNWKYWFLVLALVYAFAFRQKWMDWLDKH